MNKLGTYEQMLLFKINVVVGEVSNVNLVFWGNRDKVPEVGSYGTTQEVYHKDLVVDDILTASTQSQGHLVKVIRVFPNCVFELNGTDIPHNVSCFHNKVIYLNNAK